MSDLKISVFQGCRKSVPLVQGSNISRMEEAPKGKNDSVSPKYSFPSHAYETKRQRNSTKGEGKGSGNF